MQKYATLDTIRRGDWLIKASAFDDQILIFFFDCSTMDGHVIMFYNEEHAFDYIETLVNQ